MIQLQALSGKLAGTRWVARHFPVHLGRGAGCEVLVDDPGVFERHAVVLQSDSAFIFRVMPPAIASVNGEPVQEKALRAGDVIEIGSAQLRFGLSPTRHSSLLAREILTWVGLALLCLAQVALVYLLG